MDNNSTKLLSNIFKSFEAKEFVDEDFSYKGIFINGKKNTWKYLLSANVIYNGTSKVNIESIKYYLTGRIDGYGIVVGTPKYNLTFTMTDHVLEIVTKLINANFNSNY